MRQRELSGKVKAKSTSEPGAVYKPVGSARGTPRRLIVKRTSDDSVYIYWRPAFDINATTLTPELKSIPMNDATRAAVQLRIDQSVRLFQLGFLVTGGLWGIVLAKKDEITLTTADVPEILMFSVSTSLLIGLDWLHVSYLGSVGYWLHFAGTMGKMGDIFDSTINLQYDAQSWFLGSGFIIAVFTLFSAHRLRRS